MSITLDDWAKQSWHLHGSKMPTTGDRKWCDCQNGTGDRVNYEWDGIQWLLIERRDKNGFPVWMLNGWRSK